MTLPLLRLSADVWSLITRLLNFHEVKHLLLIGNPHVSKVVGSGAHSAVINGPMHALNLNGILTTAKATPNLKELCIYPPTSETYTAIKPLLPLAFPKLSVLEADFHKAFDLLMVSNSIAELVPSLLSLKIRDFCNTMRHLSELKFPSKLERLELMDSLVIANAGDIANFLPRRLAHMEIQLRADAPMTYNEWPPELSTLHLYRSADKMAIEHLPRSLTHLSLINGPATLTSSFKPSTSQLRSPFPWRQFFPALISFTLSRTIVGPAMELFKSLVTAYAYDASEVSTFLSSGFWHSPQLDSAPDTGYPLFEHLSFNCPSHELIEVAKTFAPLLQKVAHFEHAPLSACRYLPLVTTHESLANITYNEHLPTNITRLRLESCDIEVLEKQTALKTLNIGHFNHHESDVYAVDRVKWPSSLQIAKLFTNLSVPSCLLMPSTLTELTAAISTRKDWSAIASHLVCLKVLSPTLFPDEWHGTAEPLAPIKSTQLESLHLNFCRPFSESPPQPFLHEFFGETSTLPPSLTELTIVLAGLDSILPLSLIAFLPRQLREIKLLACCSWTNSFFKTDPLVSSMSPSELLSLLPQGTEVLELIRSIPNHDRPKEALKSLPRGLRSFAQRGLFMEATEDAIPEILEQLPPRLAWLHYDFNYHLHEAYCQTRRPYLFRGLEPTSSTSQ